jgi:hypothetical protein
MNNSPQFLLGPKFFYVQLGCKSRRRAIRSIGTNTQISHRRRRQIRRQFDFFLRRTKTPNRRPRKPTIPSPSKNPPAAQRLRPHAARPRLRSAVEAHRERGAEPRGGARQLERAHGELAKKRLAPEAARRDCRSRGAGGGVSELVARKRLMPPSGGSCAGGASLSCLPPIAGETEAGEAEQHHGPG